MNQNHFTSHPLMVFNIITLKIHATITEHEADMHKHIISCDKFKSCTDSCNSKYENIDYQFDTINAHNIADGSTIQFFRNTGFIDSICSPVRVQTNPYKNEQKVIFFHSNFSIKKSMIIEVQKGMRKGILNTEQ